MSEKMGSGEGCVPRDGWWEGEEQLWGMGGWWPDKGYSEKRWCLKGTDECR